MEYPVTENCYTVRNHLNQEKKKNSLDGKGYFGTVALNNENEHHKYIQATHVCTHILHKEKVPFLVTLLQIPCA